jgi:NMD protein affecting ribosome stability and mRNA decay
MNGQPKKTRKCWHCGTPITMGRYRRLCRECLDEGKAAYIPTPEQIAEGCAIIRAENDARDRERTLDDTEHTGMYGDRYKTAYKYRGGR